MDNDELTPSDARLPDPRPETMRLARLLGVRLRTPLERARRDELAADLAVAAAAAAVDAEVVPLRRRALDVRRLSVAAAVLVLLVGAVGVLVRSGDDLPVIALAGGPVGPGAAMGMGGDADPRAEVMRADAGVPDIGWWIPTRYRFVLADGVVVPGGRAAAWLLAPPADLAGEAARLASVFDLPALSPSEWDPSALAVQTPGGASLWISSGGDWYYGGPSDLWPVWDCPAAAYDGAVSEGSEGSDGSETSDTSDVLPGDVLPIEECRAPEPPTGVPSVERATALATDLLARAGHTAVRITDAHRDEWGAWVQAEVVLPGEPGRSGLFVGVGFAGEERVSWANGTLARPERLGDYPLVDLAAALVRLESDMNAWLDGVDGADTLVPMPRPAPADLPADAPVDAPAVSGDGSSGDSPVTILPVPEEGTDETGPGQELPGRLPGPPSGEDVVPVERDVRIIGVEVVTMLVWTADERVVLLPHYRFVDEDGGWWFVIALEDRHLTR